MIIKSHALIETLVTELILSKIEKSKLRSLIERLPLSDTEIGKIKIAKDYALLSSEERKFIKTFSELRNKSVHKFENIDFNLTNYVDSLDRNQKQSWKQSWKQSFTWFENSKTTEKSWKEKTLSSPKIAVWLSPYMFVATTVVKINELNTMTKIDITAEKATP